MNTDRDTDEPRRPGLPVTSALLSALPPRLRPSRGFIITVLVVAGLVATGGWQISASASSSSRASALEPAPPAPEAAELAPSLQLPEDVNVRVDRWIERFLTDQRHGFQVFLSRESIYAPMIRQKLRERAMPEDLLYVAMIESGFHADATSPVEASGLWQFMGPTARHFGLRMDGWVDERRDPVRATDAALDYLEQLHARFDSWYLAAAAYNAGPNRVARSLRRYGAEAAGDEKIFWEIVDDLPRETRNYVPKLLAAILLAKEAEKHGFRVERSEPYDFDRVWVPGQTSLVRIAEAVDAPVGLIRDLNPHLVRDVTPPGTSYGVRVPPGRAAQVVASLGRTWSLADD